MKKEKFESTLYKENTERRQRSNGTEACGRRSKWLPVLTGAIILTIAAAGEKQVMAETMEPGTLTERQVVVKTNSRAQDTAKSPVKNRRIAAIRKSENPDEEALTKKLQISSMPSAKQPERGKKRLVEKVKQVQEKKNSGNRLSPDDMEILYRIVEAECTGASKEQKRNVAHVILNRIASPNFPNSVGGVVFQSLGGIYQFSPVSDGRYYSVKITKETKEACDLAVNQKDITGGCLFFNARGLNSWASRNRTYRFTDGIHVFFQ